MPSAANDGDGHRHACLGLVTPAIEIVSSPFPGRAACGPCPVRTGARDEPVPYSLPAKMTSGVPALILHRRVVDRHLAPSGSAQVAPPSLPPSISFLMRMLAKVPRIITSWLPRDAP